MCPEPRHGFGENYTHQHIPSACKAQNAAYPIDLDHDFVDGNFWLLYPNTTFGHLPGSPNLSVSRVESLAPERSRRWRHIYGPTGVWTENDEKRRRWGIDNVTAEDIRLCEAVQRGMHSRGFSAGALHHQPRQRELHRGMRPLLPPALHPGHGRGAGGLAQRPIGPDRPFIGRHPRRRGSDEVRRRTPACAGMTVANAWRFRWNGRRASEGLPAAKAGPRYPPSSGDRRRRNARRRYLSLSGNARRHMRKHGQGMTFIALPEPPRTNRMLRGSHRRSSPDAKLCVSCV